MADEYCLRHWDNSKIKTLIIVLLGFLKGKMYIVSDNCPIATFSVRKSGDSLHLGKLATLPEHSGKGVGSWCMEKIEKIAKDNGCSKVKLEVYDKSNHAKDFYLHKGYYVCGKKSTLKYTEYKMEKEI